MKKYVLWPLLAAIGGVGAFLLRLLQRSTGFEVDTGLPIPGNLYAILLVAWFVVLAAVCLLAVPAVLLRHDTAAAMPFLAMMAPVGLIAPSVMLPTTYKLGATKGRVVYIVMLMVVAGVCALLVNLSKESGAPATLSPLATMAISLAVFIGSWALSVKWFKAREL